MDIQQMINAKKEEKQKLIEQMDLQKELFLKELCKFIEPWINNETKNVIKSNSEKVLQLGEEKARIMKSEIENLRDNSVKLVKKYMEENHVWWHKSEDNVTYFEGRNKIIDRVDKQIKKMLGELGNIFKKHNIIEFASSNGFSYTQSRSDYDNNGYRFSIGYSDELYEINNNYIKLIRQVQSLNEDIRELEEQKKKENVEDWWESL